MYNDDFQLVDRYVPPVLSDKEADRLMGDSLGRGRASPRKRGEMVRDMHYYVTIWMISFFKSSLMNQLYTPILIHPYQSYTPLYTPTHHYTPLHTYQPYTPLHIYQYTTWKRRKGLREDKSMELVEDGGVVGGGLGFTVGTCRVDILRCTLDYMRRGLGVYGICVCIHTYIHTYKTKTNLTTYQTINLSTNRLTGQFDSSAFFPSGPEREVLSKSAAAAKVIIYVCMCVYMSVCVYVGRRGRFFLRARRLPR